MADINETAIIPVIPMGTEDNNINNKVTKMIHNGTEVPKYVDEIGNETMLTTLPQMTEDDELIVASKIDGSLISIGELAEQNGDYPHQVQHQIERQMGLYRNYRFVKEADVIEEEG